MARTKETMVMVCRKHWTALVLPVLVAALFIVVGLVRLVNVGAKDAKASLVITAIGVMIGLFAWISYKSEYIALADSSVIGHKGILRSKKLTAPLNKVQSVGLSNGVLGKIFKYHTVTVATAATDATEFVFKQMAQAQAFADAVNAKIAG